MTKSGLWQVMRGLYFTIGCILMGLMIANYCSYTINGGEYNPLKHDSAKNSVKQNVILITSTTKYFLDHEFADEAVSRNMSLFTNLVASGYRVYFYLNADNPENVAVVVEKMEKWLQESSTSEIKEIKEIRDMTPFVISFTIDDIVLAYPKIRDEYFSFAEEDILPEYLDMFLWSHHDATYAYWYYNIKPEYENVEALYIMEADSGISGNNPSDLFEDLDTRIEDLLRCDIDHEAPKVFENWSWVLWATDAYNALVGDMKFACAEHFQRISVRVVDLIDKYYKEGIIGQGEMYIPSILFSQDPRVNQYKYNNDVENNDTMFPSDLTLGGKYPEFSDMFSAYDLEQAGYLYYPYFQIDNFTVHQFRWDELKRNTDHPRIYHKVIGG